jgi:hypothetical protein
MAREFPGTFYYLERFFSRTYSKRLLGQCFLSCCSVAGQATNDSGHRPEMYNQACGTDCPIESWRESATWKQIGALYVEFSPTAET